MRTAISAAAAALRADRSTWLRIAAGLVAVAACGGPTGSSGSGAECVRDDQCNYGLICAVPTGGTERVCTNDVAGLVAQDRPDLPAAEPPEMPVDPATGGMAPVDPGTGGMAPVDPGTGGMAPVDPGTGGSEPMEPPPGGTPGG